MRCSPLLLGTHSLQAPLYTEVTMIDAWSTAFTMLHTCAAVSSMQTDTQPTIQGELARAFFWRMKASGHIIIIITSYQEFPGIIVNPFDDRHTTPGDRTIHEAVDGYLHCFRCAQADTCFPATP